MIDSMSSNPYKDFMALKEEVGSYKALLLCRPYGIGISKAELLQDEGTVRTCFPQDEQKKLLFFSSFTRRGMDGFRRMMEGGVL